MRKKVLNLLAVFAAFGLASCSQAAVTPTETPVESGKEDSPSKGDTPEESKPEDPTPGESSKPEESTPGESSKPGDTSKEEENSKDTGNTGKDKPTVPGDTGTPAGYYDSVNVSLTGEAFRRNLSETINKGFKHYSYKDIWEIDSKADADPENPNNIISFYTGESIPSSNHTEYNREHVWAKSHGFPKEGCNPYSDAHHLRACEQRINSTRNNSDFYEFGPKENPGKDEFGNKWTGDHFEPRDEVKGDVARIMFYMATMYGFDGYYNLTLTNDSTTSGSSGNGKFGGLETLVKWSLNDPVSETEIRRNNVIYGYQKNRNPYIDHPEYVLLAYPEYAKNYDDTTVDNTKVDEVVNLINALPGTITLDVKSQVVACQEAYEKLNWKEKAAVKNYAKLSDAVNTIKKLENPQQEDDKPAGGNTEVTGNINIDLTGNGLGNGFAQNPTFKTAEFTIKATYGAGASKGEAEGFKLGANGKNISKASLNINGETFNAALYIDGTVFKNAKSVEYVSSKIWDNLDYTIFFVSGDTYTEVSKGQLSKQKDPSDTVIKAELDAPKDGTFVLAIKTSGKYGCRLTVKSISIKAD